MARQLTVQTANNKRYPRSRGILLSCSSEAAFLLAAILCSACNGTSTGSATTTTPTCDSCCIDVSNSAARACEAVLEANTTQVATFSKSIRGSSQQMGTKFAVAFTAREDKPLAGSLVNFSLSDGGICSIKLTSSTCYDRLGKTIDNAAVQLHGAKP